jgi:hypothetical protein
MRREILSAGLDVQALIAACDDLPDDDRDVAAGLTSVGLWGAAPAAIQQDGDGLQACVAGASACRMMAARERTASFVYRRKSKPALMAV